MYAPGRGGKGGRVGGASRCGHTTGYSKRGGAGKARGAVAREATDTAFSEPVGQAIAARRRLLSGVYQTMGSSASAPRSCLAAMTERITDALKMAAAANMPERSWRRRPDHAGSRADGARCTPEARWCAARWPRSRDGVGDRRGDQPDGRVGGLLSGSQVLDDLRYRDDLTGGRQGGACGSGDDVLRADREDG